MIMSGILTYEGSGGRVGHYYSDLSATPEFERMNDGKLAFARLTRMYEWDADFNRWRRLVSGDAVWDPRQPAPADALELMYAVMSRGDIMNRWIYGVRWFWSTESVYHPYAVAWNW